MVSGYIPTGEMWVYTRTGTLEWWKSFGSDNTVKQCCCRWGSFFKGLLCEEVLCAPAWANAWGSV